MVAEEEQFPAIFLAPDFKDCSRPLLRDSTSVSLQDASGKTLYKMVVKTTKRQCLNRGADSTWRRHLVLTPDCSCQWRALYKPPLTKRHADLLSRSTSLTGIGEAKRKPDIQNHQWGCWSSFPTYPLGECGRDGVRSGDPTSWKRAPAGGARMQHQGVAKSTCSTQLCHWDPDSQCTDVMCHPFWQKRNPHRRVRRRDILDWQPVPGWGTSLSTPFLAWRGCRVDWTGVGHLNAGRWHMWRQGESMLLGGDSQWCQWQGSAEAMQVAGHAPACQRPSWPVYPRIVMGEPRIAGPEDEEIKNSWMFWKWWL